MQAGVKELTHVQIDESATSWEKKGHDGANMMVKGDEVLTDRWTNEKPAKYTSAR